VWYSIGGGNEMQKFLDMYFDRAGKLTDAFLNLFEFLFVIVPTFLPMLLLQICLEIFGKKETISE